MPKRKSETQILDANVQRVRNMSDLEKRQLFMKFGPKQKEHINEYGVDLKYRELNLPVPTNTLDPSEGLVYLAEYVARNPYLLIEVDHLQIRSLQKVLDQLPKGHPFKVELGSKTHVRSLVYQYAKTKQEVGCDFFNKFDLDFYFDHEIKPLAQHHSFQYDWPQIQLFLQEVLLEPKFMYHYRNGYLAYYKYAESAKTIAKVIKRLVKRGTSNLDTFAFSAALNEMQLQEQQTNPDFEFSDEQIASAKVLLEQGISLLTGYAGTGKSTLMNIVVQYLVKKGATFRLAAFSGKATNVLAKMVHHKTSTVHRLYHMIDGSYKNPDAIASRDLDYVIIDEIGMLSQEVLAWVLGTLDLSRTRVILIGDIAQLPAVKSVGFLTGTLDYLKKTHFMEHVNLTKTFRQAGSSAMLDAAMALRDHKGPILESGNDLTYLTGEKAVLDQFEQYTRQYGIDEVGALALNNYDADRFSRSIQNRLHEHDSKYTTLWYHNDAYSNRDFTHQPFYIDDVVMMTDNFYKVPTVESGFVPTKHAIMNGQRGKVTNLYLDVKDAQNNYIDVEFMDYQLDQAFHVRMYCLGKQKRGPHLTVEHLIFAYAMTVHKSQGSTIPYTVFYMGDLTNAKIRRQVSVQLLYTAFTRAKKHLSVVFDDVNSMQQKWLDAMAQNDVYLHMNSLVPYYLSI